MNTFRDSEFTLANFNEGHAVEALDRLHMTLTHLEFALYNHPGLTAAEAIMVGEAATILAEVYQSVGARAFRE
jgi:hypothetical protein